MLVGEKVVVLLTEATVVILLAYACVWSNDLCRDVSIVGVVVQEFQIIIQALPNRRYFRI